MVCNLSPPPPTHRVYPAAFVASSTQHNSSPCCVYIVGHWLRNRFTPFSVALAQVHRVEQYTLRFARFALVQLGILLCGPLWLVAFETSVTRLWEISQFLGFWCMIWDGF